MKRDPAPVSPFHLFERILLGGLTALLVAIPFTSGEDPGRLRLTSGAGPVSLSFCFMLLLLATCVWRTIVSREALSLRSLTPLLLAGVGAMAFWSSQQGERYAHPGLYIAWNWIGLGVMFYLVRVLGKNHADSRGFLNAMLAAAVSISCLGIYQALTGPLELRNLDAAIESSSKPLAGTDEFYPELNAPPVASKPTRGTFDSPQTLLMYLFLFLPLALAMGRAAMRAKRSRWLLAVPGIIIAGMIAALAAKPFDGEVLNVWPLISEHSLFGIGPGNLSRTLDASANADAWPELAVTIGLIGLALFFAAIVVATMYAWPRLETPETSHDRKRWEFLLGGGAGLVLAFLWALGELPAEAPPNAVLDLGSIAVIRAAIWFGVFALLETVQTDRRSIGKAIAIGAVIVLAFGFVVNSPGKMPILGTLFALLALAANFRTPPVTTMTNSWTQPIRGLGGMAALTLVIAMFMYVCLPAWTTASSVREARIASRLYPDMHREFERTPPGGLRANALTNSHRYLNYWIVHPLRDAANRDPKNAALLLELARWLRPLWEYELLINPEEAARVADETRRLTEFAAKFDPKNLAAKRSQFEAFLLYRRHSKARDAERIVALNKIIGEIAIREPTEEIPLRLRFVRMLIERNDAEALPAEISTLLKLNRVEGAPHGRLTDEQRKEVIEAGKRLLKNPPKVLLDEWTR